MKMRWWYTCVLIAAMVVVLPAGALTITTDADYTVNEDNPPAVATDQDGPNSANSGHVFSNVHYGIGEVATTSGPAFNVAGGFSHGHAASRASASGDLAAAAFFDMSDDVTSMDFHATSVWTETITNNTGSSQFYTFDFFFAGGSLELGGNGGMAMFTLDILLNGSSIWSASASLVGSPAANSVVFDDGGLAHTAFDGQPNFFLADFDPFSDSLDLGLFNDGEQFDITYELGVWTTSTNQLSYGEARVGDPFSINPIPEPATMSLLGMGLLCLGARQARKRR